VKLPTCGQEFVDGRLNDSKTVHALGHPLPTKPELTPTT
jgi:hypothetical protein